MIDLGVSYLEIKLKTPGYAFLYKVLYYLGLGVNRNRPPPGERPEVYVVALAGELQVDAAVLESLLVKAVAEAGVAEQADGAILEDAGPLARLAVGPAAVLYDDRVDSAEREQVREQQAGRA